VRPRWLAGMFRGPLPRLGNLLEVPGMGGSIFEQSHSLIQSLDPSLSWKDIDWLRRLWRGRLVLKGILSADDALLASNAGVDAIVVSNHGGRQLDGTLAAIDALPSVVAAVGNRMEVLFDGGIRRGRHVAVALAMGARACLIGRAQLYGLAAAGEVGVARVLHLLADELKLTCALMGKTALDDLSTDDLVNVAPRSSRPFREFTPDPQLRPFVERLNVTSVSVAEG
jgi:L-lactate dehydrogenase (cytochrome)